MPFSTHLKSWFPEPPWLLQAPPMLRSDGINLTDGFNDYLSRALPFTATDDGIVPGHPVELRYSGSRSLACRVSLPIE